MLASQMGFQICRALKSYFGVLAAMEVYGWIPRIVRRAAGAGASSTSYSPATPAPQSGAIHREVLIE
jgi:hypothetical protein